MGLCGSVGCTSNWRPGGCRFNPRQGGQHSFMEIDHEIFSAVILSLLLIQEGQMSVSGERMCTILVNSLEDWVCSVKVWLDKLTTLHMALLGWQGHKTSTQTNSRLIMRKVKVLSRLFWQKFQRNNPWVVVYQNLCILFKWLVWIGCHGNQNLWKKYEGKVVWNSFYSSSLRWAV